jgi:hypothetical protein
MSRATDWEAKMKKDILYRTGLVAAVLAVSACSNNSNGSITIIAPGTGVTGAPAPAPTGSVIDLLGAGFASIFRASPTSEPRKPVAGDLTPVSSTADPINF